MRKILMILSVLVLVALLPACTAGKTESMMDKVSSVLSDDKTDSSKEESKKEESSREESKKEESSREESRVESKENVFRPDSESKTEAELGKDNNDSSSSR